MGRETANGYWANPYYVSFPFSIDGIQLFYGHNIHTGYYLILQELLPHVQMGIQTAYGSGGYSYSV